MANIPFDDLKPTILEFIETTHIIKPLKITEAQKKMIGMIDKLVQKQYDDVYMSMGISKFYGEIYKNDYPILNSISYVEKDSTDWYIRELKAFGFDYICHTQTKLTFSYILEIRTESKSNIFGKLVVISNIALDKLADEYQKVVDSTTKMNVQELYFLAKDRFMKGKFVT